MSTDQQPKQLVCPSCGSANLKTTDTASRAQCQSCLFHCLIASDGTTSDDRDTPVETRNLTLDDLQAHPAFLQVFARRFAEFAGIKVSDEAIEIVANHRITSKLPKPSDGSLA